MIGRNGNYGGSKEAWKKLSQKVWQRDNYTCRYCKRHRSTFNCGEYLNTHHILPLSKGGTDSKANLTTICSTCHNKKHGHLGKVYSKNIRLRNGISKVKRLTNFKNKKR